MRRALARGTGSVSLAQERRFALADGGALLHAAWQLIQRPYTDDVHAYYEEGIKGIDPSSVDSLHVGKSVLYTALGRRVYGGEDHAGRHAACKEYSEFTVELLSQGYLADFCVLGGHAQRWWLHFRIICRGMRSMEKRFRRGRILFLIRCPRRAILRSQHIGFRARPVKGWICSRAVGKENITGFIYRPTSSLKRPLRIWLKRRN